MRLVSMTLLLASVYGVLFSGRASAADIIVTSTADSGPGSLRQALLEARTRAGAVITFSIPGTSPFVITPQTPLPLLDGPGSVTIDGYSQPGAVANTSAGVQNAKIAVEIDGRAINNEAFNPCLVLASDRNRIAGLAIYHCYRMIDVIGHDNTIVGNFFGRTATGREPGGSVGLVGVRISGDSTGNLVGGTSPADANYMAGAQSEVEIDGPGAQRNRILGNIMGTDVLGRVSGGLADSLSMGVSMLQGASFNEVGGNAKGEGNLISGMFLAGVLIDGAETCCNVILGNRLGTNADGTGGIGSAIGVSVRSGATDNHIGGSRPGDGNLISGNQLFGIELSASQRTVVQGNLIGVAADGRTPLPNAGSGIQLSFGAHGDTIGGLSVVQGNTIAFNENGIRFANGNPPIGIQMLSNRIYRNHSGSIIWENYYSPPSDSPNHRQPFPILTEAFASHSGGGLLVRGTLSSDPAGGPQLVQVFADRSFGLEVNGGLDLVGTASGIPAGPGPLELRFTAQAPVAPGDRLLAMATTAFGTSQLTNVWVVAKDNQPPVSTLFAPATAAPGTVVVLDGTFSTDPDHGPAPLAYSWRQIAGPQVEISNANAPLAFFTAPPFGSLTFELSLSDGVDTVTQQVHVSIPRRSTRVLNFRN
jgi:hypothetical protein